MPTSGVAHEPTQSGRIGYVPLDGVYDEMIAAEGHVRPAFTAVSSWFSHASPEAQASRARQAERLMFDYFSDPQEGGQPWHLDLAPLLFASDEWATLEAAALQRARLYDAMLSDFYGPQTLFASGTLPPDLVLNDPSYLRPLYTGKPRSGHLTFFALDFARGTAGNWRVIDVHTETPAGHGFVLANRMVMAEVAPDLFRFSRALPIGPFYEALSESLYARAPVDNPTIAILTSSPGDAAFVGHTYMARYLGFVQVQGSDLRVLDQNVYLKTIDGLKKIDILLRAVEARGTDPIELSPDAFDGPVGLVQAARHNFDLVVNSLGSAIVENRGMSPFLGGIARALLGEDLLINDTPRRWLGQKAERELVSADLDSYAVYECYEGTGSPGQAKPGKRSGVCQEERAALEDRIALDGNLLVAERPLGFATTPAWTEEGLKPKPYALRVFVGAMQDGYRVMPGGVALTIDDDNAVALTSREARSRDVWVISPQVPSSSFTLKRMAEVRAGGQRHAVTLQSRVADNLFWLGRYCERADATLRLIRQALTQTAPDLAPSGWHARTTRALQHLLDKDQPAGALFEDFEPDTGTLAAAVAKLCTESDHTYGLPRSIDNIKGTALQCRDRLSTDSWRILTGLSTAGFASPCSIVNAIEADVRDDLDPAEIGSELGSLHGVIDTCDHLITQLSAFAGLSHENMTRNRGRQFLDLGRRLERAQQLSELIYGLFVRAVDPEEEQDNLTFALFVADSYITYRSRYRFAPELRNVLDLLMVDETNPRSLAFQLSALNEHVAGLPKSSDDAVRATDHRLSLELLSRVQLSDINELVKVGVNSERSELKTLLSSLIVELPQLSETISRQYFSLADEQPQRLRSQMPR